jgi:hypothetical protein
LCRIGTTEELNKYINLNLFIILILLFAGISYKYKKIIGYIFSYFIKYVKKSISLRESAEEFKLKYFTISNMSSSQRLKAGNFIYPYLVGLIEGDG